MAAASGRTYHAQWMTLIVLLSFGLRIFRLDFQSIWYDEAFYATVSSVDLASLPDMLLDVRVHPPLYFLLLHFWLALGHGEFVLRALSAFAGVLAVAAMHPLGTAIWDKRLGIVSALALAISPFHIWYSQEVKMYSLISSLVLLSSYFIVRLLREDNRRNWLGYGILTLLAVYTHYLALCVMLAHMTFLTLRRQRYRAILGKWLVCALIIGLLYVPWLGAILLRGGFYDTPISWIPAAQPVDLFWTIYDFAFGSTSDHTHPLNILAAVLLAAVLTYVSVKVISGRIGDEQRDKVALVWLWLFLPLVLIFLISLDWPLPQKRSIYMDRYLTLLLPAFVVLVCFGVMRILQRNKALGALVAVALLVPATISDCSLFLDERYHRDQWRQAIAEIRQHAKTGDLLLVRPQHHVVLYYYDAQEIPWCTVPYLGSKEEYEAFLASEVPAGLSEDGTIWTIIVSENANAHRFVDGARDRLLQRVADDEVRGWLTRRYHLLDEKVYRGIYLASYTTTRDGLPPRESSRSFVPLTDGRRYPYTGT